jgi:Papain-like cysteine protease AvrRpt2
MCRNVRLRGSVLQLRHREEEFRDGMPVRNGRLSVGARKFEPMTRPTRSWSQPRRKLASLFWIITSTPWWCGSPALAQTAEDQAAFRSYQQLCSQVQRGTWEMRTTLCAMLEEDAQIVKTMIAAQVGDVCRNIDKECGPANEQARGRLKSFASTLKCPSGASICTRETIRPATLIDARAAGTIPTLKQPTSLTCWATVATMLYSWKHNRSDSIPSTLGAIGKTYLEMFRKNQALSPSDKPGFLLSMGLKAEAPQNYTAGGWAALIRQHGPLWITTNEGTQSNFSIHARVMSAIFGDGSPSGTTIVVYDPADGQVHTETLGVFAKKFEDVARGDLGGGMGDLRPQVVHY